MTIAEQWWNEGFEKGFQQGIQQGIVIRERLDMIEFALTVRFGEPGERMMERIRDIRDLEKLKIIKDLVKSTDKLSDVEKVLL